MAATRTDPEFARYYAPGVVLTGTGSALIVPAISGRKFLPVGALVHTKTLTGVIIGAAIVRLGNNGNHDNVAPLFTVPTTTVVDALHVPPLATALVAIDIGSTGISVEVQTAVTGASALTADVHLYGFLV